MANWLLIAILVRVSDAARRPADLNPVGGSLPLMSAPPVSAAPAPAQASPAAPVQAETTSEPGSGS